MKIRLYSVHKIKIIVKHTLVSHLFFSWWLFHYYFKRNLCYFKLNPCFSFFLKSGGYNYSHRFNYINFEYIIKSFSSVNASDSEKLAEILMQRPINIKPSFTTRLSDEDILYFQEDAKRHFNVVLETLKQMPRNMLFVVR